MGRHLARLVLATLLVTSLAGLGWSVRLIAQDPLLRPLRDATISEINASLDRALLAEATTDKLSARLEALVAASPRDWVIIDALVDLAKERALSLPPELLSRLTAAREEDTGFLAEAGGCAACAWDAAACSLSQALVCHMPVAMTPIGDLAGIGRTATAWVAGSEIDAVDLTLSVVGLAATGAIVVSGGSSGAIKAGATLAKTAARMGRLSPGLVRLAVQTASEAVDIARLSDLRSLDDLAFVLRPKALAPIAETLADLDRLRQATDVTTALHVLPLIDGPTDARAFARLGEATGPKLIGRAEVLGKARLLRATNRVAGLSWALFSGFVGLTLALAGLAGQSMQALVLRSLRRSLRAR